MNIKHKIKIRKVTGIGVHGLATGDSLDLSDDPKGERRSPASDGESARRSVPADDMKQPIWINEDEEYCKHLARFFKGNDKI